MEGGLPDLLEALGEVFISPGACPLPTLRAVRGAEWTNEHLREGLDRMIAATQGDLPVAYAGLFLAGRPSLPLEASAYRGGLLRDPELLDALEPCYQAAGVRPLEGVSPDHLGALLALQARLLRLMAAGREDLEPVARELAAGTLGSLARSVAGALTTRSADSFYAAAGTVLEAAAEACAAILG